MTSRAHVAPVLLIADPGCLVPAHRIWGTGGWVSPDSREALDWICLARGLGWDVEVVSPDAPSLRAWLSPGRRWIVVGCDPADLTTDAVDLLRTYLEAEPVMVIGRAGDRALPWSRAAGAWCQGEPQGGRSLSWLGECPEQWTTRERLRGMSLNLAASSVVLARLDHLPLMVATPSGRGILVTLGFHPSEARDADGCSTALLRKLLVCASLEPVAWFDLARSLALRMDDPGSAQSIHLASWSYPQLGVNAWQSILEILSERAGRLSVGYVGGWVDDGDASRGILMLGDKQVGRSAGRVFPSAEVVYRDIAGNRPGTVHDYAGQYGQLRKGLELGLLDIELHGHTHMHPDRQAWAAAPDRYTSVRWYRELGGQCEEYLTHLGADAHPIFEGLREIVRRFQTTPSTLICPGDEWGQSSLEIALAAGIQAISSYYFAFRFGDRFCWSQHVCAPYLNEPNASWFDSGLPVVGYFHDTEPSLEGPRWLEHWIDEWLRAGADHLVSLRVLAAAHTSSLRIARDGDVFSITAVGTSGACIGTSLPIRFFVPRGVRCSALRVHGAVVQAPPAGAFSERHSITIRCATSGCDDA